MAIDEHRFREDLYYRVSEITINIPPLREREGGRLILARTLLDEEARKQGRSFKGFSTEAQSAIQNYPWPGNVRELENKIKGAVIMAEGKYVTSADLGLSEVDTEGPDLNLREVRRNSETRAIKRALVYSSGNISRAAKILGITRPTLYDLLEKYNIQAKD